MARNRSVLFALNATQSLGERVASALGVELAPLEEREFEDGEHKARPLDSVRGADVYVLQSLHGGPEQGPNDKLVRLLFVLATLKDLDAARVTAVVPYLAYARKDRRTKPRDPVNIRYTAQMLEATGCDRVVTLDVHNTAAFENAFRRPVVHLEARWLFAEAIASALGEAPAAVVSPDAGGVKRADRFRQALGHCLGTDVPLVFVEKFRSQGVVSGGALVGDVSGRTVVIVDDLIASGTTMTRAAMACLDGGAGRVFAAATHGLFMPPAEEVLGDPALARLWVGDSVPAFRLSEAFAKRKLETVPVAPLLGEAIRRLNADEPITELLE